MTTEDMSKLDITSLTLLNRPDVQVLSAEEERRLLAELEECKQLLLESGSQVSACSLEDTDGDDELDRSEKIQERVRELIDSDAGHGEGEPHLATIANRYNQLRTKLAMANLRLVAHVAKKYRNRGVSTSDLLQEGFCGLLKAIDRFEPARETRLASYAVWWIRQALQRSVAANAYPVRLNPRHLQQLARSSSDLPGQVKPGDKQKSKGAALTLRQIQSATRPAISINGNLRADEGLSLIDSLAYPAHEESNTGELDEYLVVMMKELKPRERTVLQLRYGLGGQSCHSLSEVSEVLDVSKERIRQIQEGALQKLRTLARGKSYCESAV